MPYPTKSSGKTHISRYTHIFRIDFDILCDNLDVRHHQPSPQSICTLSSRYLRSILVIASPGD